MARKPEMVGDKPKFRMVKAKKRRGIRALGRPRAIGGMERQILNPATGKYVSYLGPKQEMRMYSPKALAKIEKSQGARKLKKAAAKKKAADESGLTATREKGEEILRQKKAGTYKPKKVDQKLIDKFNQSALGKSGDGKVSFDPSTGQYTLDAFGAKKTYSADELSKAIATKKKDAPTPPKPPKTATQPTAKVADKKLLDQFSKTALGKSGDGKVSFDEKTGKYVLDAFGAKKSFTPDEFKKQIVGKKETPKAEPKAPAKVAKGKIEKRRPTGGELEPPTRVDTTPKPKAPAKVAGASLGLGPRSREDIQIDIPEVINIPGVGQIKLPSAPPPAPKEKPKTETKAKAKPKPRPVKLPDVLREDIRIAPGTLEELIGGEKISAPTAPKPPVETSEGPVPRPGKIVSGPALTTPGGPGSAPGQDARPGGINPGMGVYRPDGTEYRLMDPDYQDYKEAMRGESAPTPAPAPTAPKDRFAGTLTQEQIKDLFEKDLMDYDDDYFYDKEGVFGEKGLSYKKGVPEDVVDQIAADVNQAANQAKTAPPPVAAPPPSDVMPGEVFMDQPGQRPPGDPVSAPTPPKPPQIIDMDPLKGFRESYVPRNILGQSFDPSVRDDYERQMQETRARMMQPGGNIMASEYPTYQTPTMAVPQTQFGGYGQPMPIAPLLPYAGLASSVTPEQVERRGEPASGARVNPGTGEIEPIGMAPDPRLLNLPPGVSGPIR